MNKIILLIGLVWPILAAMLLPISSLGFISMVYVIRGLLALKMSDAVARKSIFFWLLSLLCSPLSLRLIDWLEIKKAKKIIYIINLEDKK